MPGTELEVYSTISYDTVVCISLSDPTRLYRGAKVQRMEKGLEIPLGEELLGRVVDLFGNPIDGLGEIRVEKKGSIYRDAPHYDQVNVTR